MPCSLWHTLFGNNSVTAAFPDIRFPLTRSGNSQCKFYFYFLVKHKNNTRTAMLMETIPPRAVTFGWSGLLIKWLWTGKVSHYFNWMCGKCQHFYIALLGVDFPVAYYILTLMKRYTVDWKTVVIFFLHQTIWNKPHFRRASVKQGRQLVFGRA